MEIGEVGLELIKEFEDIKLKAYQDIAGVWTIGYGTTRLDNKEIESGMTCALAQAEQWLRDDVNETAIWVARYLSGVELTQYEFDAMCCMTYNIGKNGFFISTLRSRVLNKMPVLEKHFTMWNKARVNGVLTEVAGLTRRRKAEFHLYSTGTVKTTF